MVVGSGPIIYYPKSNYIGGSGEKLEIAGEDSDDWGRFRKTKELFVCYTLYYVGGVGARGERLSILAATLSRSACVPTKEKLVLHPRHILYCSGEEGE